VYLSGFFLWFSGNRTGEFLSFCRKAQKDPSFSLLSSLQTPETQPGIGSFFWKWLILCDILAERHKFTIKLVVSTHFEKYARQIGSSPQVENKEYLKRPSI